MKFMLDTDTCIYIIKKKPSTVLRQLAVHSVGDIGISSITLAELQYGVAKSRYVQRNQQALSEFMVPFEIAGFDERAAEHYGSIRADLEKKGKAIGSMDMLIGAHALSLGVTLVTNNVKEFRQIKDLIVANWTS
jgi:tRNA(fMet)-specific endonuclease VapC